MIGAAMIGAIFSGGNPGADSGVLGIIFSTLVGIVSSFIVGLLFRLAALNFFSPNPTTTNAVYSAVNAVCFAAGIDLRSIILKDFKTSPGGEIPAGSIKIYGERWHAFQAALRAEGCAYWGKMYQGIFEKNFELDPAALKERLQVPKEIRDLGAAAVARHLEALERQRAEKLKATSINLDDEA